MGPASGAGRTGEAGPSGAPTVDWRAVLAKLDSRRAKALEARDQEGLAEYAAPGSAALESDAQLIAELAERSLRPVGLTTRIVAVEDVRLTDAGASIQVVDKRGSYELVDGSGQVQQRVAGTGQRRWRVALVPGGDPGWRVSQVEPVK